MDPTLTSQTSPLFGLPLELLHTIADYTKDAGHKTYDLLALRCTCRALSDAYFRSFASQFVAHCECEFTRHDRLAKLDMLLQTPLVREVRHIRFYIPDDMSEVELPSNTTRTLLDRALHRLNNLKDIRITWDLTYSEDPLYQGIGMAVVQGATSAAIGCHATLHKVVTNHQNAMSHCMVGPDTLAVFSGIASRTESLDLRGKILHWPRDLGITDQAVYREAAAAHLNLRELVCRGNGLPLSGPIQEEDRHDGVDLLLGTQMHKLEDMRLYDVDCTMEPLRNMLTSSQKILRHLELCGMVILGSCGGNAWTDVFRQMRDLTRLEELKLEGLLERCEHVEMRSVQLRADSVSQFECTSKAKELCLHVKGLTEVGQALAVLAQGHLLT